MAITPGMLVMRVDGSSTKLMRVTNVGNNPSTTYDGKPLLMRVCSGVVMVTGQPVEVPPTPVEAFREATQDEVDEAAKLGDVPAA